MLSATDLHQWCIRRQSSRPVYFYSFRQKKEHTTFSLWVFTFPKLQHIWPKNRLFTPLWKFFCVRLACLHSPVRLFILMTGKTDREFCYPYENNSNPWKSLLTDCRKQVILYECKLQPNDNSQAFKSLLIWLVPWTSVAQLIRINVCRTGL